jgi:predicted nuclease of predicted toxin-antitoxin system
VKIKLDENLPARLVSALVALGHEVDTVPAEGLAGFDDARVWRAAQADGRFFITQDLDFADVRRFVPGSHHGVPILRLRTPGAAALFERVTQVFATEATVRWVGRTVIASDRKVRLHG